MSEHAPAVNHSQPAPDLLARLAEGSAEIAARKKPRVPSIIKSEIDNMFGRYWQEIKITDSDGTRWEFFGDVYRRGVELQVAARVNELLS